MHESMTMKVKRTCMKTRVATAIAVSIAFTTTASAEPANWINFSGGYWSTAANWSTNAVPTNTTAVVITNNTTSANNSGGNTVAGYGVNVDSLTIQAPTVSVSNNVNLQLLHTASLGSGTYTFQSEAVQNFLNGSSATEIFLHDTASAGTATVQLTGSANPVNPFNNVLAAFVNNSTAAGSSWTASNQARIQFQDLSTAANAVITNNSGGMTAFLNNAGAAGAGNATITNNAGGLTIFGLFGAADNAIIVNNVGGAIDITRMSTALSIGSLNGAGNVYLASKSLNLGNLNGNDEISGVIQDGVSPDALTYYHSRNYVLPSLAGGSLTKVGSGVLTLSGNNTFTGGLTITAGVLQLGNGGVSGSVATDVVNDAILAFNRADEYVFSNTISGSGNVVKMNSGSVVFEANHAYQGGTTIQAGTLQLGNGGTAGSVAGDIINDGRLIFNRSDDVTFNGAVSGLGSLQQSGTGTTRLTGSLTYGGPTVITSGSLILDGSTGGGRLTGDVSSSPSRLANAAPALRLENGAMLTGNVNALDVTVGQGATWTVTGSSAVGALVNSGVVDLQAPDSNAAYVPKSLQVSSLTSNGGVLVMDSVLGDSGSLTDRLIVNGGQVTGTTLVNVRNLGGLGGLTSGSGIDLIHLINGAQAQPGAFSLYQPVLAGAYQYSLHQEADSDFYLTSDMVVPASPPSVPTSPTAPPVTSPEVPDAPPRRIPNTPNYRAEVPLYSAIADLGLFYSNVLLGTTAERRGSGYGFLDQEWQGGHWFRTSGRRKQARDVIEDINGGVDYRASLSTLQLGSDMIVQHSDTGAMRAGVYAAMGNALAKVDHHDGSFAGKIDLKSFTLGTYWTGLSSRGWFMDATLQATLHQISTHSQNSLTMKTNGREISAALESGYRFPLGSAAFMTPQLQLSAQHLKVRDAHDSAVDLIRFDDANSVQVRAGVDFARHWNRSDRSIQTWIRPSLVRELKADPSTYFQHQDALGVSFASGRSRTAWTLLAGIEGDMSSRLRLSLQANYARSIGTAKERTYGGQLDLQYRF